MDIRTKLVFAFVATSLAAMLALGAFSYEATQSLLRRIALRQLSALAESKKQDLERVIVGWRDRVQLVASRTALRESLRDLGRDPEPAHVERIERILADALGSTPALRGVSVYAADGTFVVSEGIDLGDRERMRPAVFMWSEEPVSYQNVTDDPDEGLLITFITAMRIGGVLVGAAKVRLSAQELIDATHDYTGLGETGETLMARRTEAGEVFVLNPVRHGSSELGKRVDPERTDDPILQAVLGTEALFHEGARDYRGAEIWAATRYLKDFDWGIVVKVDAEEELAPVRELRETLVRLGLSLGAFAVVVGTLFGFYVSRPIRELAEVARRIGEGEHDLRAPEDGQDEVAFLARTLNGMADALVRAGAADEASAAADDARREGHEGRVP